MKKILFLGISLVILCGCNHKAKEKIGLVTTGPDEYQVSRNKPLEIPPHYTLSELPVPEEYKKVEILVDEKEAKKKKSGGLFKLSKKKSK